MKQEINDSNEGGGGVYIEKLNNSIVGGSFFNLKKIDLKKKLIICLSKTLQNKENKKKTA